MKFTFRRSQAGETGQGGIKPRYWLALGPAIIILLLVGAITTGTVFAQSTNSSSSSSSSSSASSSASSSSSGASASSTTPKTKFDTQDTFLNNLATALGISRTTLNGDLGTAAKNTVQQAVTAGKLTQAQADKIDQAIDNGHLNSIIHSLDAHNWAQSQRGKWRGLGNDIATALGIQPSELSSELKSGKTLQQVITDHGKTTQDVVDSVVAQVKTKLDAKVTAGKITPAQETKELDSLKTQLTNAIETNQISGPFHVNIGGWMHGKTHGSSTSPNTQPNSNQQATPQA